MFRAIATASWRSWRHPLPHLALRFFFRVCGWLRLPRGVRLRHTAAVLWLTAGVHFIQVAKWLGHSSYVLTLTTYADYIADEEAENPLPGRLRLRASTPATW